MRPSVSPRIYACKTLPLAYVSLPKSGCTTIKNIMHALDDGAFLDDPLTIHERKDLLVQLSDSPDDRTRRSGSDVVFTFVRHPLKRAYSGFNEKLFHETKHSMPVYRRRFIGRYQAELPKDPTLEQHRADFKRFLAMIRDARKIRQVRNAHWAPQAQLLKSTASSWRVPNVIAKIEEFDRMMPVVLGMVGASLRVEDVPRMNEGPPAPHRYEDIVDDEILSTAEHLFAEDLRQFGYSL